MPDRLRVDVDGGEYTVVMAEDGRLSALRRGDPWRDCAGDELILAMAREIEELRGVAAGPPVLDDVVLIGVRADLAPACRAAPELLAACEAALKYIESCVEPSCDEGEELEDGTVHDGSTPEGNALRAAVAKARSTT